MRYTCLPAITYLLRSAHATFIIIDSLVCLHRLCKLFSAGRINACWFEFPVYLLFIGGFGRTLLLRGRTLPAFTCSIKTPPYHFLYHRCRVAARAALLLLYCALHCYCRLRLTAVLLRDVACTYATAVPTACYVPAPAGRAFLFNVAVGQDVLTARTFPPLPAEHCCASAHTYVCEQTVSDSLNRAPCRCQLPPFPIPDYLLPVFIIPILDAHLQLFFLPVSGLILLLPFSPYRFRFRCCQFYSVIRYQPPSITFYVLLFYYHWYRTLTCRNFLYHRYH